MSNDPMTLMDTGEESVKVDESVYPEGFFDALDDPDYLSDEQGKTMAYDDERKLTDVLDRGEGYIDEMLGLADENGNGVGADSYLPATPPAAPKRELDNVSKWAGRIAVGGAALAAGAAVLYQQSKPPRKRKTKTQGQKLGMLGLGLGIGAAVLAGAAYGTSAFISSRISPKTTTPAPIA